MVGPTAALAGRSASAIACIPLIAAIPAVAFVPCVGCTCRYVQSAGWMRTAWAGAPRYAVRSRAGAPSFSIETTTAVTRVVCRTDVSSATRYGPTFATRDATVAATGVL